MAEKTTDPKNKPKAAQPPTVVTARPKSRLTEYLESHPKGIEKTESSKLKEMKTSELKARIESIGRIIRNRITLEIVGGVGAFVGIGGGAAYVASASYTTAAALGIPGLVVLGATWLHLNRTRNLGYEASDLQKELASRK